MDFLPVMQMYREFKEGKDVAVWRTSGTSRTFYTCPQDEGTLNKLQERESAMAVFLRPEGYSIVMGLVGEIILARKVRNFNNIGNYVELVTESLEEAQNFGH